jgi:hypothetical protein
MPMTDEILDENSGSTDGNKSLSNRKHALTIIIDTSVCQADSAARSPTMEASETRCSEQTVHAPTTTKANLAKFHLQAVTR